MYFVTFTTADFKRPKHCQVESTEAMSYAPRMLGGRVGLSMPISSADHLPNNFTWLDYTEGRVTTSFSCGGEVRGGCKGPSSVGVVCLDLNLN